MRDVHNFDEASLAHARPWRASGALVALLITCALTLLAAGVLIGAYSAAARAI